MYRVTTLALAVAGLLATAGSAGAASFCAEARHADERTVCRTPGMVRVDRNMNRAYQKLMGELGSHGRHRLRSHQREWLAERRSCRNDATCIRLAYRERMQTFRSIARRRGIDLDE
jgi:uncharacterized protein